MALSLSGNSIPFSEIDVSVCKTLDVMIKKIWGTVPSLLMHIYVIIAKRDAANVAASAHHMAPGRLPFFF